MAAEGYIPIEESTSGSSNPFPVDSSRKVRIVLVGKGGAGKSTLARNILGSKQQLQLCASRITTSCSTQEAILNGITVEVTDTVGLTGKKLKNDLEKICKHSQGKAFLVIYCLPVNYASKFNNGNPAIMKSLQDAFGKDIWKHCLLVFTFSNIVLDRLKKDVEDENEVTAMYKTFLKEHATKFREELRSLKVRDVNVREVFGFQTEALADEETTIVALPAGDEPFDPVFPDFKDPTKFTIPLSSLLEESVQINITDWREILFIEIIRKCGTAELKKNLLQHRYSHDCNNTSSRAGGLVTLVPGATLGATLGAVSRIGQGVTTGIQQLCKCCGQ